MTLRCAARHIAAVCCAALLAAVLATAQRAHAKSDADAQRGEAKAASCAPCHGGGDRAPAAGSPLLDGQPEQFLVLQMVFIREGLRDVQQMAGLLNGWPDRDVSDVAAYYSRRAPVRSGDRRNEALYARGAELSKAMGCASCHRVDYQGQQQMPRLAGQREDYLVIAMKAYRDNRRTGSDTSMNGVLYQVGDRDIEALAHYLALQ